MCLKTVIALMKPLQYAEIGLATTATLVATGATVYSVRRINATDERIRVLTEAIGKRMMMIDHMGERIAKLEQAIDALSKNVGGIGRLTNQVTALADELEDASGAIEGWARNVVGEIKTLRAETTLTPLLLEEPATAGRGRRDAGKRSRGAVRGRGARTSDDEEDEEEERPPRRRRR